MKNEEMEAYLRKHTLNGAMRELHDALRAFGIALLRDIAHRGLAILDTLGM